MNFFEKLKNYDIILASKSPRRQQLLKEAHIPFRVVTKNFTEAFPATSNPEKIVLKLCRLKANAFSDLLTSPEKILITADTVVYAKNEILNKPADKKEAINMLEFLSGNAHDVYTGVCILTKKKEKVFFEKTSVIFEKLLPDEIEYYVEKYKPYDKAGGYGIQEWIGLIGVKCIEGSYHNVVGMPVSALYKNLKEFI